jgi:hypothetical protein
MLIRLLLKRDGEMARKRALIPLAMIGLGIVVGRLLGYPMGGNVVVRCRRGHLFTTIWVPFASVKSLRLGWWRLQRCPVGHHWSLVNPVKDSSLTDEERTAAHAHKDIRLP